MKITADTVDLVEVHVAVTGYTSCCYLRKIALRGSYWKNLCEGMVVVLVTMQKNAYSLARLQAVSLCQLVFQTFSLESLAFLPSRASPPSYDLSFQSLSELVPLQSPLQK